ncbi:MAG: S-methyl-5-thioribose-1-phosphate isomerase [Chthonomonadales bacterium]|nr:S-methyl-5-thioribose-1-phosphate isomerase [Chthonomonadales bacterium]
MPEPAKVLQTVAWKGGRVRLIDQTALPERLSYVEMSDWRDVAQAIRTMVVRGAPAIGCTAALGMALGARGIIAGTREGFLRRMEQMAETFRAARPTAVNLFWAVDRMMGIVERTDGNVVDVKDALINEALAMLAEDIHCNRALGANGATLIADGSTVLTHCNAGALATVGFGTALGVIRAAVEEGKRVSVYADETRPRLQGMKLTAWELQQEGIPVTVITDSMAAVLMREGKVDCVIVGADRIAANGDTANKIGTYSVAVLANYHRVPFYVAAPASTVDPAAPDGRRIPIEERETVEMTHVEGIRIAPDGVQVWNPGFDVTPAELISAFITEQGVIEPPYPQGLARLVARQPVAV